MLFDDDVVRVLGGNALHRHDHAQLSIYAPCRTLLQATGPISAHRFQDNQDSELDGQKSSAVEIQQVGSIVALIVAACLSALLFFLVCCNSTRDESNSEGFSSLCMNIVCRLGCVCCW